MTTKQMVMQTVKNLPANASIEDAMEKLLFLAKIEKGIHQADAGKTTSRSRDGKDAEMAEIRWTLQVLTTLKPGCMTDF